MIMSSLRPVWGVMEADRSTSDSFLIPSGVNSKAQEKTSAGMKPMANRTIITPCTA